MSNVISELNDEQEFGETAIPFEEISQRAYELWVARGCPDGSPDEDWFRAQEELRQE